MMHDTRKKIRIGKRPVLAETSKRKCQTCMRMYIVPVPPVTDWWASPVHLVAARSIQASVKERSL